MPLAPQPHKCLRLCSKTNTASCLCLPKLYLGFALLYFGTLVSSFHQDLDSAIVELGIGESCYSLPSSLERSMITGEERLVLLGK